MTEMTIPNIPTEVADALRGLVMMQLIVAVICITVIVKVKKIWYTTGRASITCLGIGMIIMCVFGACTMSDRLGQPIGWRALTLWTATLLIDVGSIGALRAGYLRRR